MPEPGTRPPPTCRRPREAEGAGGAESGGPSARRRFKYRRLERAANQREAGGGTHRAPRPRLQGAGGSASGERGTLGAAGAGSHGNPGSPSLRRGGAAGGRRLRGRGRGLPGTRLGCAERPGPESHWPGPRFPQL